jgi:hypothetical protein
MAGYDINVEKELLSGIISNNHDRSNDCLQEFRFIQQRHCAQRVLC